MAAILLHTNDAGYVELDMLLEFIDKLPKVQQAIIHLHIQQKFKPLEMSASVSDLIKAREAWIYSK